MTAKSAQRKIQCMQAGLKLVTGVSLSTFWATGLYDLIATTIEQDYLSYPQCEIVIAHHQNKYSIYEGGFEPRNKCKLVQFEVDGHTYFIHMTTK